MDEFKKDTVKTLFKIENEEELKNDNIGELKYENDVLSFGEWTQDFLDKQNS